MSKDNNFKTVENKWLGRSLTSYKAMHSKTAENKGVAQKFHKASTLTEARKVLWGLKKNQSAIKK